MKTVRTVAEMRARVADWRRDGLAVALVPTMGGLHDGHLSLVRLGRVQADRVIATIFVNPTQFGANEDLDAYPRDEAGDAALLSGAGCDLLFAPAPAEVYPPGFATRVIVDGLTDSLCGAARPGHFDGVSQVVCKLLNQAGADVAVFGEKDWQQLAVVRRMARDLDIPTRILGGATVREADGLAMSSRNRYLTHRERAVAAHLPRILADCARRIAAGEDIAATCAEGRRALTEAGFAGIDYLEPRTAETLAPVLRLDPATPARLFAAAHLGRARLIDNMPIA